MMVPKKSLLLAGAALALFGASSSAQSQSGKVFARYNKPLKSATLDLATGTITRGPAVNNRAASTIVDFANNDLGGFVGVDTGGGFCEWFDSGVKGTGAGATAGVVNNSDLMNSVVFAYCSASLAPGSGGVGGSVKLGFYEGYTIFGGAPTTAVAVFTLTGLPANSASSSFFGGFNCFFIRILFGNLICFADGPIGYSWKFLDNGTGTLNPIGATLAATWPFLSCVRSCSSAVLQVDSQGMTDAIDQYCPPGYLRATFTFGTTSGSFTSMSMHVEEAVDTTATLVGINSTTNPNPDTLTASPAVVGGNFTAAITLHLGRTKGTFSWQFYIGLGATRLVVPPTGAAIAQFTSGLNFGTNKRGRMLLVNLNTSGFSCTGTHSGVSGSSSLPACNSAIPKDLTLVCNQWAGQAVILGNPANGADGGGNARLSSAVDGVVGTN
jgi:hypothetical protein